MNSTFLFDKIETRNSNKKYFAKAIAFLKGSGIDHKNSIISDEAKQAMSDRMKELDIVVDVEHDSVAAERPNLLPVAKARSVEWQDDRAVVEIELNEHSPQFKTTWGSLKNKFLDAVSVAFKPIKWHTKVIDGNPVKVFTDVTIDSLGFTGRTATSGTNILEVFTRSVNETEGEKKMDEKIEQNNEVKEEVVSANEQVQQEEKQEEVKAEEKVEEKADVSIAPEKVDAAVDAIAELLKAKDEIANLKAENASLKVAKDNVQPKSVVNTGGKPPYAPEEQAKAVQNDLEDKSIAELLELKEKIN